MLRFVPYAGDSLMSHLLDLTYLKIPQKAPFNPYTQRAASWRLFFWLMRWAAFSNHSFANYIPQLECKEIGFDTS